MSYDDTRVRALGARGAGTGGEYVLYWMQIARRLDRNHALDCALRTATALGKPLVIYEGLRLDYPWASRRIHRFVLEGMQANAAAAEAIGVNYWPWVEATAGAGRGLLARLASRATAVVTDDFPCFIIPRQTQSLAERSATPILAVDGNSIVPLALLGAPVATAAQLRRRIHRAFAEAWAHRAARRPQLRTAAARRVSPPFELADLTDVGRLLDRLPVDERVPPVADMPGGSVAARRQLERFVKGGLAGYAEHHSEPAPPAAARSSGLSAYLHFGHISVEEVAERVLVTTGDWTPAVLRPDAVGSRQGFFSRDADVNSFLDEAITWRDVGLNWHRGRAADAERLEAALPAWAISTLRAHGRDRRQHVYDREAFEAAATHDPLWNAAQSELVATGRIHGYLRMLWGKKVIEWSRSPAEA
ncbi:MAG TPA: deoxyribodipyrimidine photolyase, partial [Candidatus Methylomirabilis sp.]|nr:deoxyribodipyrimidine photolyase [Candidatus Methylomirabilis sp.]